MSRQMPGLLPGAIRGLMMDRPLLVAPLLQYAATYHADTDIVTRSVEGPVRRQTYAETLIRAQRLANALISLGVKPGDRVATLAWNTWRHIELYYAVAGIGAICHTINPRLSSEQLRYIIDHADDCMLFFDLTFADAVAEHCPKSDRLLGRVVLSDAAHRPANPALADVMTYEELIAGQSETYDWPEFDENTAASLCYTSGTTGNPKGVLYSHRTLVLHSFACCMTATMGLSVDDRVLPVVPMFHVNAWGIPYAAPMSGAALILPGRALDGPSLFDLMENESVSCAQGVPTVWMSLLTTMREKKRKPKSLRRILVGGAAASEMLIEAFETEFDVQVNHAWGMTEMTPLGVVNTLKPKFKAKPRAEQMPQKLKQGRVVYGVDMRIVDDAGKELPHDGRTPGHLQVRGPWIVKEYFKSANEALTPDGWFETGDIATLDPDGYMQITDRSKDVIKSGGEWISSVDLENAALGHPQIAHAAVIGIPHPKWQERPLLICVARGPERPTLQEVNAYLETKVPKWWLPDVIAFVDAIPLGPTGKIQKTRLREQFKAVTAPG
ncbi:MAG: long-chain-fatty-acid--CoA ligase [Rhodospirillaceae bacterium]|nr:long-chain-fatty-acid--CoA ligase [Rhodospirillaceae bacterium]